VGALIFIQRRFENSSKYGDPRSSCFYKLVGPDLVVGNQREIQQVLIRNPDCIMPYGSMTFFEILISEIGLDVLAQSMAKNRYR
jgi:hypothetical protein